MDSMISAEFFDFDITKLSVAFDSLLLKSTEWAGLTYGYVSNTNSEK